jgi:hypothetical protein
MQTFLDQLLVRMFTADRTRPDPKHRATTPKRGYPSSSWQVDERPVSGPRDKQRAPTTCWKREPVESSHDVSNVRIHITVGRLDEMIDRLKHIQTTTTRMCGPRSSNLTDVEISG